MRSKNEWIRQLLTDFEGRLLRYSTRYVPEQIARDLVQETFLKLWQKEPHELIEREAEWLFHVCRNLTIDYQRKEGRMRVQSEIQAPEPLADQDQTDVSKQIERRENQTELMQKIEQLTAAQQEVIRLKFQEGLSYKEISRVTGHSVSYVGVLIHEGMTYLRGVLRGSK